MLLPSLPLSTAAAPHSGSLTTTAAAPHSSFSAASVHSTATSFTQLRCFFLPPWSLSTELFPVPSLYIDSERRDRESCDCREGERAVSVTREAEQLGVSEASSCAVPVQPVREGRDRERREGELCVRGGRRRCGCAGEAMA
ncbi:hypothetical protein Syun_016219 [Stephania yunnanensis]|uniref:Uncharacterized protein n=1 Tax=Stephania yunnanensis TaxID=152371 RepID=A0AAP0J4E4_9MAGN